MRAHRPHRTGGLDLNAYATLQVLDLNAKICSGWRRDPGRLIPDWPGSTVHPKRGNLVLRLDDAGNRLRPEMTAVGWCASVRQRESPTTN
jgi:hypothetical protein